MTTTTLSEGRSLDTDAVSGQRTGHSSDAPAHPFRESRPPDPAIIETFVGQVMTDFAAAAATAMTVIGDRLGLYQAMNGAGRLTVDELAARTHLNRRLVAEWVAGQTVAGYLTYEPDSDTYELPVEHAMVLATASPAYVIGAAEIVAGQYATLSHLESAFRGDGGVNYHSFPDTVKHGIERFFSTAYQHQLADLWFPAVPGLVDKLTHGVRVADIGAGHGAATLLMARLWPRSSYTGFDSDRASINVARSRAVDAGLQGNVTFEATDATGFGPGPYDVVTFFDALHDLGNPRAALERAHDLLTPGGIVVAVEPWSTDRLHDSINNPIARIGYAISASLCTPTSLAQPGGYALGNGGGPTRRIDLLTEAGFLDAHVAVDTGRNLIITAHTKG